jgi:hypothetical protein
MIKTVFLGRRSAHTPPTGERRTPDKTFTAKINPSSVALPPASRISIASAIGKADSAITVKRVEIEKSRNALKESKAPGSKYFRYMTPNLLNIEVDYSFFALRLART